MILFNYDCHFQKRISFNEYLLLISENYLLIQYFNNLFIASPSKLFSSVDANTILKSPLNNSSSKSQYSFSKQKRFPEHKPYCEQIYNLPDHKSMRKTSFGFGKKTDLDYGKHKYNHSPSPHNYKIATFVDINKGHNKGSSCHVGRERTTPQSYIELDRIKFPGPGNYNELRYNQSPKWTMRPITKQDLYEKTTQRINPGPGAHDFQQMNPEGKYFISKFHNSGSKIWNPKTSQRFNKSSTDVPGAGTYNPVFNDMSDSGKYVLSKDKGTGKRRFDMEVRESFVKKPAKQTKTPGPGRYRLPSDFGQYDELLPRFNSTTRNQ